MAVHNKATTIKTYHNVDVNSNDKVLGGYHCTPLENDALVDDL